MKHKAVIFLALVLVLSLSPAAGQAHNPEPARPDAIVHAQAGDSEGVKVVSERAVADIVGEERAPLAMVSPDGSAIAWAMQTGRGRNQARLLCLYLFANADKTCTEAPEAYLGYPYQLEWSPDSAYIAFSENPQQLGHESDIWLFDVVSGAFTNRTDDGVEGSWRSAEPGTFALDYLPMWNAADGNLYFWRSEPLADFQFSLELYRLSPQGGEPELVRDLSEFFRQQLLLFDYEFYYLDGVSAISPDGAQLAMAVRSLQDVSSPENGLWLLDLTNDQAPPQQLATMTDFQAALPAWQPVPASPVGLSWTADSAGVVVMAASNDIQLPLNLFYYADVAGGEFTPVVDFSGIEDESALFSAEAGSLPPRYYSPWTASLSPAGDKLMMYNNLGGLVGLLSAPLPPDGELPGFVYESQFETTTTTSRSSSSSDGKMILSGILFTLEEEGEAGQPETEIEAPAGAVPVFVDQASVQVSVVVQGSFPDSCTSLGEVTQTVEDNTISVTLTGDQPEGLMCAQALTPFEETIPLDVSGLPAGEYTVDVNGSTTTLVLPADQ